MRGRVTTSGGMVWSTMCQESLLRRLSNLTAVCLLAACQNAGSAAAAQLQPLVGHTRGVTEAAFSADGELLVSASEDRTVRLWSMETATCNGVLQHEHPVHLVRFLDDNRLLTMSVRTGRRLRESETFLCIWDITTQQQIWRHKVGLRRDANAEVAALATSRNANAFAALVLPFEGDNDDVVIQVWQGDQPTAVANFEVTRRVRYSHHRTSAPCFAMQGRRLLFAGSLREQKRISADSITIIDTSTWEVSSHIPLGGGTACMITSAPGNSLVAADVYPAPFGARRSLQDNVSHVRIWDIVTGQLKAQSAAFIAANLTMEFVNEDHDLGLFCWRGSSVKAPVSQFSGVGLMSINNGQVLPIECISQASGGRGPSLMMKAAFCGGQSLASGRCLAAYGVGSDNLLHLVDTADRTTVERLPLSGLQQLYVSWIAFSPSSRYLALAALPSWGEDVPNSELERWKNRFLVFAKIDH